MPQGPCLNCLNCLNCGLAHRALDRDTQCLGDLQENVISNVMKGGSLLQLGGMDGDGVVSGLSVWRPLLPLHKDAIFDFAHKYGVPYFKDSTPGWSTRGKLRNQLWPLLEDMYGGFGGNLTRLAAESEAVSGLCRQSVFGPLWETIEQLPLCSVVDCNSFKHMPHWFWKETLKHVSHSVRRRAASCAPHRLHCSSIGSRLHTAVR